MAMPFGNIAWKLSEFVRLPLIESSLNLRTGSVFFRDRPSALPLLHAKKTAGQRALLAIGLGDTYPATKSLR